MKLDDLKREIEATSNEDKLYLLAYLMHVLRRDVPDHKKLLADRISEMRAGNRISLNQVKRLHEALEAAGL